MPIGSFLLNKGSMAIVTLGEAIMLTVPTRYDSDSPIGTRAVGSWIFWGYRIH
jgi:hypothetical protein